MATAGLATTPAPATAGPVLDPDIIRAVIVLDPVTMPGPDSSPRSLSSATAKVDRISAMPDIIPENETLQKTSNNIFCGPSQFV